MSSGILVCSPPRWGQWISGVSFTWSSLQFSFENGSPRRSAPSSHRPQEQPMRVQTSVSVTFFFPDGSVALDFAPHRWLCMAKADRLSIKPLESCLFHIMSPKKLSWVKNITYELTRITWAVSSRPLARSARGELGVRVCVLNTHSIDLLPPHPSPRPVLTCMSRAAGPCGGREQGRHQTLLFWIVNYDFLSSIFWLHCYTKDEVASGLWSLLWD